MDWKVLGQTIEKVGLPILGGAIAGPEGAMFGKMAASALGLDPTTTPPQDIANAIATNADNVVKLRELETKHEEVLVKAAYDAATAQVQATNATLQADAKGSSWLQRNHHAISELATVGLVIGVYFVLPLIGKVAPTIPGDAFLMLGGILGVTAWHVGRQGVVAAQQAAR